MLLVVANRPGTQPDPAIRAAIQSIIDAGELPRWAMPERIEVVEALDKTSVGKVDKKVMRARYC